MAIFVTGAVFGGGALVFKEFTEGFACLLGGFTVSMWLLTLKPGGLITSSGGKGAFIGILMVTAWALSWTQYTRPYALIGSISFSGATAFTLGIDCFTRAGLKEFWFYIWNLNNNLFPLNTNTFPLTRGIKVEIAIIVVGTIIGILSQVKLWKVIKSKEREQQVVSEEDSKQREAVEAALGRHLQRQNEREKSEWEKQYGNRLSSQRNTVLWQDAHPEKRYSSVSVLQIHEEPKNDSTRDLEMNAPGSRRSEMVYGSRNKRQSSMAVDVIEEVEEGNGADGAPTLEHQKALQALERPRSTVSGVDRKRSRDFMAISGVPGPLNEGGSGHGVSIEMPSRTGDGSKLRRLSQNSLSQISKRLSPNYDSNSQSQEHLIDGDRPQSRASSAAATLDIDNENLDASALDVALDKDISLPPAIVISPAGDLHATDANVPDVHEGSVNRDVTSSSSENGKTEGAPASVKGGKPLNKDGATKDENLKHEESDVKKSQSHTSESDSSSTGPLTKTALTYVPSQLSSVVLSYRTNEWAKHITSAEEPIYDEPDTIEGVADELPTQLAPLEGATEEVVVPKPIIEVPPAASLPPTVQAGGSGVGIASRPSTVQRSYSDQERPRSATRPRPTSGQSFRQPSSRGNRSSHNLVMQSSLVTTPIDENMQMEFNSPKDSGRRLSAPRPTSQRSSSSSSLPGIAQSVRPYASTNDLLSSNHSLTQYSHRTLPSSGTRMDSHNSHQPPQRDLRTDAQKRESLLAEWRLAQQHRAASTGIPSAMADKNRAQMKADKDNQKMREEYQRTTLEQKQHAMDQLMRRPDMQDLHREAMRKMQAGVNKKMRSSSD